MRIFKIVPLDQSMKLDGNGFTGSDGWLPGDYGALESVYTLGSNWSPDGTLYDPPTQECAGDSGSGTKF